MDKTKQWGILTGAAILAVLVAGWFLLISPQRNHASELRTQAGSQESQNHTLEQRIAALKSQHKDLPAVQAELARLAVQLPDNPALPALIRQLSTAADAAGVDLVALRPSEPQYVQAAPTVSSSASQSDSASSSTSDSSTSSAPAKPKVSRSTLAYIPLELKVAGNYFQVEQFVSNLEANKRAFLVTNLDAVPETPDMFDANGQPLSSTDATSTSGASGDEYDGYLGVTITGRVFMNAANLTPAPTTAAAAAK